MHRLTDYMKKKSFKPKRLSRRTIIIMRLIAVLIAVAAPILIIKHNRDIRRYSGAETDNLEQLNFDVGVLEEYRDGGMVRHNDGTYIRLILLKNNIELRLWRDMERPELPLREQIREEYPGLVAYKALSVEGHSEYLAEKCSFESDGRRHTSALIRRGGWDYLIDLSTSDGQEDTYKEYIDRVMDSVFFL